MQKEISDLIDVNQVKINEVQEWSEKNYPDFVRDLLRYTEKLNRGNSGYFRADAVPIKNVDTSEDYTEMIAGKREKWYTIELGNPNAEHRMVYECSRHGGEHVHKVTGYLIAKYLLENPNEEKEKVLDKVRISVLPVVDPLGAHKGIRGYVTREGDEVNSPVITKIGHNRNPFGVEDTNGVEGRNLDESKGARIRSMQNHFLNVFGPVNSWASLHETTEFPNIAFKNEGVMFIVGYYLPEEEVKKLSELNRELFGYEKILGKIIRSKFIEEQITNHPTFERAKSIRNRVRNLGLNVYSDNLEKAMRIMGQGGREISVGESISINGLLFRKLGILLAPDFYTAHGATSAITIETFSKPESDRVKEGLGFLEAMLQVEVIGRRFYK